MHTIEIMDGQLAKQLQYVLFAYHTTRFHDHYAIINLNQGKIDTM